MVDCLVVRVLFGLLVVWFDLVWVWWFDCGTGLIVVCLWMLVVLSLLRCIYCLLYCLLGCLVLIGSERVLVIVSLGALRVVLYWLCLWVVV